MSIGKHFIWKKFGLRENQLCPSTNLQSDTCRSRWVCRLRGLSRLEGESVECPNPAQSHLPRARPHVPHPQTAFRSACWSLRSLHAVTSPKSPGTAPLNLPLSLTNALGIEFIKHTFSGKLCFKDLWECYLTVFANSFFLAARLTCWWNRHSLGDGRTWLPVSRKA